MTLTIEYRDGRHASTDRCAEEMLNAQLRAGNYVAQREAARRWHEVGAGIGRWLAAWVILLGAFAAGLWLGSAP